MVYARVRACNLTERREKGGCLCHKGNPGHQLEGAAGACIRSVSKGMRSVSERGDGSREDGSQRYQSTHLPGYGVLWVIDSVNESDRDSG